ncbi:MAG: serine/threonine-protein kinase, partial [Legionella sp.]|nr:serine/threonine-protein kinase [Legionella sp.]
MSATEVVVTLNVESKINNINNNNKMSPVKSSPPTNNSTRISPVSATNRNPITVKREQLFVCKVENLPDPKLIKEKLRKKLKQSRPAWDSDVDIDDEILKAEEAAKSKSKNNNHNVARCSSPRLLLLAEEAAQKRLERMQNEAHILSNIAHPNIVGFVDYYFNKKANQQLLFLEYVDGGDLFKEVQRRSTSVPPRLFSVNSALHIFVQILLAVEYLHRHNILHRDIKSQNVLISKTYFAKLTDLGTARQFDEDVDQNVDQQLQGSPLYVCCEMAAGQQYSQKSDMWSLGVLLFELLTGEFPFTGNSLDDLFNNIKTKPPRQMRRFAPGSGVALPPDIVWLVFHLLNKNPARRPTAKQVLTRFPSIEEAARFYEQRLENLAESPVGLPVDRVWRNVLKDHLHLIYSSEHRAMSSQRSRAEGSFARGSMARVK